MKPARPGLLGPVFGFDLVRQSRGGRPMVLRGFFALALLAVLYNAYAARFPDRARAQVGELARFADESHAAFLRVQLAVLVLMTPLVVAGVITEEKERRTLDHLLVTDLRDREIVLGKLASRLLHLGGVLLAGLPILAALQLWGGVEPWVLFAGFAATGLVLVSVAAVSVLASVLASSTVTATAGALLVVLLGGIFAPDLAPEGFLRNLDARLRRTPGALGPALAEEFGFLLLAHGAVAAICLTAAVLLLRRIALAANAVGETGRTTVSLEVGDPYRVLVVSLLKPLPPVTDRPVRWKEEHVVPAAERVATGGGMNQLIWSAYVFGLVVAALLCSSAYLRGGWTAERARQTRTGVAAFTLLVEFAVLVFVAVRTAGAVSREREKRTLESLLTLPIDRDAILADKWVGGVLHFRRVGYALIGVWVLAGLYGKLLPGALPLAALAVTAHIAFAASLGLWLSVGCKTTPRAYLGLGVVVALLVFAAAPAANLCERLAGPRSWQHGLDRYQWGDLVQIAFWPPVTVAFLYGPDQQPNLFTREPIATDVFWPGMIATFAGLTFYGTAAVLLWWSAVRRFRREGFTP